MFYWRLAKLLYQITKQIYGNVKWILDLIYSGDLAANWQTFKHLMNIVWTEVKYYAGGLSRKGFFRNTFALFTTRKILIKMTISPSEIFAKITQRMGEFKSNNLSETIRVSSKSIRTYEFTPYFNDYIEAIFGEEQVEMFEEQAGDEDMILDKTVDELIQMNTEEYEEWTSMHAEEIEDSFENANSDNVKGTLYTTFQPTSTKRRKAETTKDFKYNDYLTFNTSGSKGRYYQRIERIYHVGLRTWDKSAHNTNNKIFNEGQGKIEEEIEALKSRLSEINELRQEA